MGGVSHEAASCPLQALSPQDSQPTSSCSLNVWLLSVRSWVAPVYRIPCWYFLCMTHCLIPLIFTLPVWPCETSLCLLWSISTLKTEICLSTVCGWRTPGRIRLCSTQSHAQRSHQQMAGVGVLQMLAPKGYSIVHILSMPFKFSFITLLRKQAQNFLRKT